MPKFRLEDVRVHLGCTQAELAAKLSVSRRSIIRYEQTGEVPAALLPHLLSLVTGEPVPSTPVAPRAGAKSRGWIIDRARERRGDRIRVNARRECWTVDENGRSDRAITITDHAALPAGFMWIETFMSRRPARWWTYRREADGTDALIRMVRHNLNASSQVQDPPFLTVDPADIPPEEMAEQPRVLDANAGFMQQERDKLSRLQKLLPIDEEPS